MVPYCCYSTAISFLVLNFEMECKETANAKLQDKRKIVFLSTKGKNAEEVPEELVRFLEFVKADIKESQNDFQDEYVKQLQKFVEHIKKDREMEERFMLFEELLKDETIDAIHITTPPATHADFSIRLLRNKF